MSSSWCGIEYVERLMKTLTNQIKGTVGGAQLVGFIITIGFQICFESVAFKVINQSEYNDVDLSKNLHIKLRRSPDQTITIINLYNRSKKSIWPSLENYFICFLCYN